MNATDNMWITILIAFCFGRSFEVLLAALGRRIAKDVGCSRCGR